MKILNQKVEMMIRLMNRSISFLAVCILISGCTTTPSKTSFYTLNESKLVDAGEASDQSTKMVLIDRIALADYLRQPGIVVKSAKNKVSISNKNRWAEGLETALPRVMRTYLDNLLIGYRVENHNMLWQVKPHRRIKIDVSQFELDNSQNQSVFAGRYWLFNEDEKLLASRRFSIEKTLQSGGFEQGVLMLEMSLKGLAEKIAEELLEPPESIAD